MKKEEKYRKYTGKEEDDPRRPRITKIKTCGKNNERLVLQVEFIYNPIMSSIPDIRAYYSGKDGWGAIWPKEMKELWWGCQTKSSKAIENREDPLRSKRHEGWLQQ